MLAEFAKDFQNFRNVFTVKRVTVMVIVGIVLVLLCGPRQDAASDQGDCSESSCPYPRHKAQ